MPLVLSLSLSLSIILWSHVFLSSFDDIIWTAQARRPHRAQTSRRGRVSGMKVEARAASKTAMICVDCGYIYDGSEGPFEKLPCE